MQDRNHTEKMGMTQEAEMQEAVPGSIWQEPEMQQRTVVDGRIMKGIAGFYYVHTGNYGVVECHAKGSFRKDRIKPLVGDFVQIQMLDCEKKLGNLIQVMPRKSRLLRPEVANVDQALVVFAHSEPHPNLNLLDKFLIMMGCNDIPCILCFNKQDTVSEQMIKQMRQIYAGSQVPVFSISATDETDALVQRDVEQLRKLLSGKETVLAGPSGVGKSTLVNRIYPEAAMATGTISRKSERGKHTTRHSELFSIGEQTYLMDTPGFTAFSLLDDMDKEEIRHYYPEFYPYEGKCRYDGCSHTHEPGCAVKEAVQNGKIHPRRYEGYVSIYDEIGTKRRY